MLAIHPNARTTPAVRTEIARSSERTGELARRHGVSAATVPASGASAGRPSARIAPAARTGCPGRPATRNGRSSAPCAVPRASRSTTSPSWSALIAPRSSLPHLDRDNVRRILKAEGLGRRPPAERPAKKAGAFKDDELGFVHVDSKRLPIDAGRRSGPAGNRPAQAGR